MKSNRLVLLFAVVMVACFSVESLSAQDKKKKNEEVVTFYVDGMKCANCKATVEKYIAFEKGVKDLKADLETKQVTITYDSKKTDVKKLKEGFEKIKFPAEELKKKIEPAKSK